MKKYFAVAMMCTLFIVTGVSAHALGKSPARKKYIAWYGTIGGAIGQESFIGAPKLGLYGEIAWNQGSFRSGHRIAAIYAGVEGSTLVWIGLGVYSIGVNGGARFGHFTLDNSFSRTVMTDADMKNFGGYNSWNPKAGIHLGPVWLKAGPSVWLNGDANWGRWMKIGNTACNIEVHYVQKIR